VQVVNTRVPLSPSSVIWYQSMCGDALRYTGTGKWRETGEKEGKGRQKDSVEPESAGTTFRHFLPIQLLFLTAYCQQCYLQLRFSSSKYTKMRL